MAEKQERSSGGGRFDNNLLSGVELPEGITNALVIELYDKTNEIVQTLNELIKRQRRKGK